MACVAARPAVIVFGVMVARWKVLGWVAWSDTSLRLFNCLINVCLTILPIVSRFFTAYSLDLPISRRSFLFLGMRQGMSDSCHPFNSMVVQWQHTPYLSTATGPATHTCTPAFTHHPVQSSPLSPQLPLI